MKIIGTIISDGKERMNCNHLLNCDHVLCWEYLSSPVFFPETLVLLIGKS